MERTVRRDHISRRAYRPRPLLLAAPGTAMVAAGMSNYAAAQENSATTLTIQVKSAATAFGTVAYTAQERVPIPGASITLRNLDRPATAPLISAVTDTRGMAIFSVETDSEYSIEASHASYHPKSTTVYVGREPQSAELLLVSADLREIVRIRIQVLENPVATEDAQAHPISGARVVLANRDQRGDTATVFTDDSGLATAEVSTGNGTTLNYHDILGTYEWK